MTELIKLLSCIWCGAESERVEERNTFVGMCQQAPNNMHALAGDVWRLVGRYRKALERIGAQRDSTYADIEMRRIACNALDEEP